jgi:hypothetical protein
MPVDNNNSIVFPFPPIVRNPISGMKFATESGPKLASWRVISPLFHSQFTIESRESFTRLEFRDAIVLGFLIVIGFLEVSAMTIGSSNSVLDLEPSYIFQNQFGHA